MYSVSKPAKWPSSKNENYHYDGIWVIKWEGVCINSERGSEQNATVAFHNDDLAMFYMWEEIVSSSKTDNPAQSLFTLLNWLADCGQ